MSEKIVSVIVPVFNTAKFLPKCLDSIIEQDYKSLQIIIVDDGSTDNSKDICREYSDSDKRVLFIEKEHEGVAASRNYGIANANGEFIIFIDSDDWIDPDMISSLVKVAELYKADITCCHYDLGNYQKRMDGCDDIIVYDQNTFIHEFLIHEKVNGSLVIKLIRKNLFNNVIFDANVSYGEDAKMVWDICKKIKNAVLINKLFYHVSIHSDSTSGGGFRTDKLSCLTVWEEIVKDVESNYPHYSDLSKARLASNAVWFLYLLYSEGICDDRSEERLIEVVKDTNEEFRKDPLSSKKAKLFSSIVVSGRIGRFFIKKALKSTFSNKVSYKERLKRFLTSTKNPFARIRINRMRREIINNDNVTLLCHNCFGGILFHDLGMRFCSPTVNTMITLHDFLKFINNLEYYLDCNLVFYDDPDYSFPCAYLDDIVIHFNHYKTEQDAMLKWNERKQRINRDNMFVFIVQYEDMSFEEMQALSGINAKGLVVFTGKQYPGLAYTVPIKKYLSKGAVGNILTVSYFNGKREYESYFDFMRWFNEADGKPFDNSRFILKGVVK